MAFKKAAASLQNDSKDANKGFVVRESRFRELCLPCPQASVGRGLCEYGCVSSHTRTILTYRDASLVANSQE